MLKIGYRISHIIKFNIPDVKIAKYIQDFIPTIFRLASKLFKMFKGFLKNILQLR